MKNLVIVESPSKSKTIEKYLGSEYKVLSSKGHIRDLKTSGKFGLGVDVENDFKPSYEIIKGKKKEVAYLKKEAKNSNHVYLATDPDREGEAISFHLFDELDIPENKYDRVVFNEITKDVIIDAFKKPRKIDNNLVKSQETRRILDRIIGFRLSKLMQSKTGGKSAGRVQSVALKLIVDREKEINLFVPVEYWSITANFNEFEADLVKYKGKKIEINNESEADEVLSKLSKTFKIDNVLEKEKKKSSPLPFKTSTLQRVAVNKLNFSAKKTMSVAQKLYEGIDIGSETVGLITYMRTDSERMSPLFINDTFNYIENKYGKEYVGVVKKIKNNDHTQDAHEAIRVTDIKRTPESIKTFLSNDEYKLYRLIYYRSLASLMKEANTLSTTISLLNNDYLFTSTGSQLIFPGYLKVYSDYEDNTDKILPNFKEYNSEVLISEKIIKEQHFTKPLPRFTESSLIKELESLGIGRPSTYATIISTLKDRGYVTIMEKKFIPSEIGVLTTDKLQEFFSNIVNVEYTKNMEDELDLIAENKMDNIKVLKEFYNEFEPIVEKAFSEMEKPAAEEVGENCPNCNHPLVFRMGRYGKFVACSNYPECKYIKNNEEKESTTIMKCPKCKDGEIVEKHSKKGHKVFYGCNNYPKCKTATWYKPTGELCPECKYLLVEKKDKITCESCGFLK